MFHLRNSHTQINNYLLRFAINTRHGRKFSNLLDSNQLSAFYLFIFCKILIQVIKSHAQTQVCWRVHITEKHPHELKKQPANLANRQIRSHAKVYENFCNPLFVFSLKGNLIYSAKLLSSSPFCSL